MGNSLSSISALPADTQSFMSKDGLRLVYNNWIVDQPRAIVFLCHGFGEHSGRYAHVAKVLNDAGYSLYALDQRGYGLSGGTRAYIDSFSIYVNDFIDFVQFIQSNIEKQQKQSNQLPCFLLGHSMGGLVASHVALKTYRDPEKKEDKKDSSLWDWTGFLFSCPLIFPDPKTATPILRKLAKIASKITPKLALSKLDDKWVSRDPKAVEAYNKDPLNYHGRVYAKMGFEMLEGMAFLKDNIERVSFPFIMMQGTEDHIVDPEGAQFFFDKSASKDKVLYKYQDHYHEIFNDHGKEKVFADMLSWIKKRLPS